MREKARGWWRLLGLAGIAAAALGLYVVWRSPRRDDLSTYGAFAAAIVTLAATWIAWAWRADARPAREAPGGPELDRVADRLAMAVKEQWERAAGERGLLAAEPIPVTWGRPSAALAGPASAAAGSRRFDPLPGLGRVGESQLAEGMLSDLHAVYGGLGSGRLVIAGAAGSGKSGAAVLLVLAALRHREEVQADKRARVPVPLLFTVQDWDPIRQRLAGWIVAQLQLAYPLFTGSPGATAAAGLVAAGKVAVILDGLDEIDAALQPAAIQALSQQGTFRLVVLSRTAELASAAAREGVLDGAAAIELRGVDPATAAGYLESVQLDPPPEGWRDLTGRIRASPGSPLAQALSSPLALTLVRDTYRQGDDARELLDACDAAQRRLPGDQVAEEITGHLLDRVLPAAYARQPGMPAPRYDLATARRALTRIAVRMNQDGTRDLQWWRLPQWARAAPRIIFSGIVIGFTVVLIEVLLLAPPLLPPGEPLNALGELLYIGLLTALGATLVASLRGRPPRRTGKPRIRQALSRKSIAAGLAFMLLFGLVNGLVNGFGFALPGRLAFALAYGLAAGLAIGLAVGLADGLADLKDASSPSPVLSWRNDRKYALLAGLAAGLAEGLVSALLTVVLIGLGSDHGAGIGVVFTADYRTWIAQGLEVGLVVGLGSSQAWVSSLAAAQLALRWHTPAGLRRFLDDARKRNVLRTVGPVYQFRHARLQDRLAGASPDRSNVSNTISGRANEALRPEGVPAQGHGKVLK
jgi:hypothetical protein